MKVLGQSAPAATTLTVLYTVPASKSTVISSLVVLNRGAAATFRISIAVGGAADATSQYLYYDNEIAANSTFTATLGITVNAVDIIRVYASTANFTFSVFGIEQ